MPRRGGAVQSHLDPSASLGIGSACGKFAVKRWRIFRASLDFFGNPIFQITPEHQSGMSVEAGESVEEKSHHRQKQ